MILQTTHDYKGTKFSLKYHENAKNEEFRITLATCKSTKLSPPIDNITVVLTVTHNSYRTVTCKSTKLSPSIDNITVLLILLAVTSNIILNSWVKKMILTLNINEYFVVIINNTLNHTCRNTGCKLLRKQYISATISHLKPFTKLDVSDAFTRRFYNKNSKK